MESTRVLMELDESRKQNAHLKKELNDFKTDRISTEKRAVELMQNLVESQKTHYEREINSLKGQLIEQTKLIESLERGKSSVLVRVKSLEQEVVKRRQELQKAVEKISELQEKEQTKMTANVDRNEKDDFFIDRTTRSLLEEISKIKSQKAELRVRMMTLERENFRLKNEGPSGVATKTLEAQVVELTSEKAALQKSLEESSAECERLQELQRNHKCPRAEPREKSGNFNEALKEKQDEIEKIKYDHEKKERSMHEEISQLKSQKTDLGVRLMSLESENFRLKNDGPSFETLKALEAQVAELKTEKTALQEALEDSLTQSDQLNDLQKNHKRARDELNEENGRLNDAVKEKQDEIEKYKLDYEQEKKEKDKLTQQLHVLKTELDFAHNDYRVELSNLSKMIASEKGISTEYINQMESLKISKRELETQLHLIENLFQESVKEKRLLEESIGGIEDKLRQVVADSREKSGIAKRALEEAIAKCEKYKSEAEQVKQERNSFEHLYKSTKQANDLEIIQLSATVLQQKKLLTHLQTQFNTPKRRCILCVDKRAANPNALTPEKMEELLDEYRRRNTELSTTIRTLQAALNEEKAKSTFRPPITLPTSREVAIIKKSSSISSDISTGSSTGQGTMRYNIPHRWIRFLVMKRTKCMACMEDLPISRHSARCEACRTTVHDKCAENLNNTCGLPMLYSDYFLEEEKRMKEDLADARMNGWIKLWRSTTDDWLDVWACLEKGIVSFYRSAAETKQGPVEMIDLKMCEWKIQLQEGVEKDDVAVVQNTDLPYIIEIRISDGTRRFYMLTPDLPSKQRWLVAFQKAISSLKESSNKAN